MQLAGLSRDGGLMHGDRNTGVQDGNPGEIGRLTLVSRAHKQAAAGRIGVAIGRSVFFESGVGPDRPHHCTLLRNCAPDSI